MGHLAFIDIFGYWIGIFLTFAILSFLYKDNPIYKVAEHLFIGVSIGYVVMLQYFDTIRPKLVERLSGGDLWYLIAVALSVALFMKAVSRKWAWTGRFPIAFVVAFYAGLQINGVAQGDLGPQLTEAMGSVVTEKVDVNTATPAELQLLPGLNSVVAQRIVLHRDGDPNVPPAQRVTNKFSNLDELRTLQGMSEQQVADLESAAGPINGLEAQASVRPGETFWLGTFSRILMLLGLIASLVYFYFSVEHKGVIGKVSRFGVWVLMLGFGAAFGFTVQGRLALAIGRALDILGRDKDPMLAAQIDGGIVAVISLFVIVAGIVAWELMLRKRAASDT